MNNILILLESLEEKEKLLNGTKMNSINERNNIDLKSSVCTKK